MAEASAGSGFWKPLRHGGRRGARDFGRHLHRRARTASSSSASCTRSRWRACSACFPAAAGVLTLVVAALVIAAPVYLRFGVFRPSVVWWVGLSAVNPRSNDYVPLFPWFGAVLVGIAAAKLAVGRAVSTLAGGLRARRWSRPLIFTGRHSLAFYLIHQPVLIGCVWLFSQILPAAAETREVKLPAILPDLLRGRPATPNSARAIVSACSTRWSGKARSTASIPATRAAELLAKRRRASQASARPRPTTSMIGGRTSNDRHQQSRGSCRGRR